MITNVLPRFHGTQCIDLSNSTAFWYSVRVESHVLIALSHQITRAKRPRCSAGSEQAYSPAFKSYIILYRRASGQQAYILAEYSQWLTYYCIVILCTHTDIRVKNGTRTLPGVYLVTPQGGVLLPEKILLPSNQALLTPPLRGDVPRTYTGSTKACNHNSRKRVRELTKRKQSCFLDFEKTLKTSFRCHLINPVFNRQLPKVSTGKSPTLNILLRNADAVFTRNNGTQNSVINVYKFSSRLHQTCLLYTSPSPRDS